jgi:hypothetical protein
MFMQMLLLQLFLKQNQAIVQEIQVRIILNLCSIKRKYDVDYLDTPIQVNKKHVRECLQETLKDMYGATMVTMSEDQQQLFITIDDKKATIDLESFVCLFVCLFNKFEILFYRKSNVMMKKFIQ